ncbi:MAG: hypothetical protein ACRYG8_17115 [Janthinobacterium lividum]
MHRQGNGGAGETGRGGGARDGGDLGTRRALDADQTVGVSPGWRESASSASEPSAKATEIASTPRSDLPGWSALIEERNAARAAGRDVMLHVPYERGMPNRRFDGLREVNGEMLALIQSGNRIMVLPVTQSSIAQFAKLAPGASLDAVLPERPIPSAPTPRRGRKR